MSPSFPFPLHESVDLALNDDSVAQLFLSAMVAGFRMTGGWAGGACARDIH